MSNENLSGWLQFRGPYKSSWKRKYVLLDSDKCQLFITNVCQLTLFTIPLQKFKKYLILFLKTQSEAEEAMNKGKNTKDAISLKNCRVEMVTTDTKTKGYQFCICKIGELVSSEFRSLQSLHSKKSFSKLSKIIKSNIKGEGTLESPRSKDKSSFYRFLFEKEDEMIVWVNGISHTSAIHLDSASPISPRGTPSPVHPALSSSSSLSNVSHSESDDLEATGDMRNMLKGLLKFL